MKINVIKILSLLSVFMVTFVKSQKSNEAIDSGFLESVLDPEECDRQINTMKSNLLLIMRFADAGIRIPKGVLEGASLDLGNYHQCLNINEYIDNMNIQGKFCSIDVPVNQSLNLPGFDYTQESWSIALTELYSDQERLSKTEKLNLRRAQILAMGGDFSALQEHYDRTVPPNPLSSIVFTLGVCVPRPCTTEQAITSLLFNISAVGFDYKENYCRLRGDKPWTGAEYAAVTVFSIIGFITLLSTSYDLICKFVLKRDIKTVNPIYLSFSVYTNGKRLETFSSGPGNLQCIDGIRTLAMLWVIVGHSFGTEPHLANPIEAYTWLFSAEALWITVATATVDTFFAIAGILLVYTTAGKMNAQTFLKNLHWFYVNRIVRITPLLAATVLLEASFFNHLGDGPSWETVAERTDRCRNNWWYTLLHVQNLLIPTKMCVGHSWYIAIDMHAYIVSPLILFWIFTGKKRNAWSALMAGLLVVLTSSTIFNYFKNVQAGVIVPPRENTDDYFPVYYLNTLTRVSPFFVGLIFGYILHLCRDRKVKMPWAVAIILWLCSFGIIGGIFYFKYLIMDFGWDNQFMDNFMNSFMRPAWACVIGWIVFACAHGYGGPINWLLSLDVWRLPARLTYGMYLIHYPLMFAINGTAVSPVYFSVGLFTFKFFAHLVVAIVASYILTIVVDSPVSALYKHLMIKVQQKKSQLPEIKVAKEDPNNNGEHDVRKSTID